MPQGLVQSPSLSLAIKAAMNCVLVYLLNRYLPQYFSVFGGAAGFVIIGSLLTLCNLFLRPILSIVTLPAKMLFTLVTVVAVNAFFLWIVYETTLRMDPDIVAFEITGGVVGWITVSVIFGVSNWALKKAV